ncbi:MAG: hypothetical protein F6K11_32305 [Leptolyngbya sp. SIO3F4]|nr:hypothetical protein [Leptolyngbya sp. SIO3F4]
MADSYYSFWLVSQEPDLSYFQAIINTLTSRFGAVRFGPYVMLYSGFLPESLEVGTASMLSTIC